MISPPDVHVFARKSRDKTKRRLTCLATGFHSKDVMLTIRKYRSPLPEDEFESTGNRPNHDGTFQLRKSVIIQEDEKADFDCFVAHRTFKEPIIVRWGSHAFSRRFYPKQFTVHSGYNYYFILPVCVFPGNLIHNLLCC
uniref:Immunoglobulin C1-set domain-containing protein n=1 Tax=Cyprinus carpio TaxID=7962 RepID=A0A8C2PV87_CYPCA